MTWSMNRSGDQSNIIHPSNVQRQKHVQHGSLVKTLHSTSARLSNTAIHSSDKDVNRGPIHISDKSIYTNNHLYTSPVKTWNPSAVDSQE